MKNWNDFLQEFVLRTLTQIEVLEASDEAYYIRASIRIARESWDAIQAAELPESEKAKILSKLPEIKQLAQKALEVSKGEAFWFAIDGDGEVWAFEIEPTVDEEKRAWDNGISAAWQIGKVSRPYYFTKELYEISKILSDDLQ